MKSFRSMFRGYAVALLAAVFFSASAQAVANKAIVRAIRDGGANFSMDGGKSWKPAKVGTVLAAHSLIRTDANATADLFLGDNGPVVRVTKDTTMGIDKLDVDATGVEKVIETQLDLKNGRILGNVKKMAAASKYEVKTPVGVAGIRGTEYSISSNGEVNVASGTVVVVYIVNGVPTPPTTVQAGQGIATPPIASGTPAQVVGIQQTPNGPSVLGDVTLVMVGITTTPQGTMQATLDNPNNPTAVTVVSTSPNGVIVAPGPGQTVVINNNAGTTSYVDSSGNLTPNAPGEHGGGTPPPPTTTPGPTTTTGNFDTTNSPLTEDKPGSQSTK